jgi:two-component system sensor histidine kinase RegB
MAAMTLAAYTFLIFWKLPLPPPQGDLAQFDALLARATGGASEHAIHSSGFALHILGMWLNFVISVGVVAFFLTRMAAALKQRERELAVVREAVLRDEQILSLGTLAAGAAHQLGTPLATMAVVIRELELNHGSGDTELREDCCCCANRSIAASRRFRRSSPLPVRSARKVCARWRSMPTCSTCSTTGS